MRKNHWISLTIALVVAGFCAFLENRRMANFFHTVAAQSKSRADFHASYFMQRLEWACFDWRFKLQGKRTPHPDVAIIAIDESSLKALQQWPWPRSIHSRLIEK